MRRRGGQSSLAMSFNRFVYLSALVGGWAALLASLACDLLYLRHRGLARLGLSEPMLGPVEALLTGAVVGAAIGAGLAAVAGMTCAPWNRQWGRLPWGLLGGSLGGAAGALLGVLVYKLGLPRALGWMVMGLGIGCAEGVPERSTRKTRNGLLGGALGGLVGGLLFDVVGSLTPTGLATFSRAVAFVVLGISIGALIGLTQVVLKEAWLTVLDGFRPGRQLILTQPRTVLGRGDHLPLPLLGYSGKDLESEHAEILRRDDGTYVIQDKGSRVGTRVNGQTIAGATVLADGDLIKLGANIVRFNLRRRAKGRDAAPTAIQPGTGAGPAPLPPPPPPVGIGSGPAPLGAPEPPRSALARTQPPSSPRIPPPPPPPGSKR